MQNIVFLLLKGRESMGDIRTSKTALLKRNLNKLRVQWPALQHNKTTLFSRKI